MSTDCFAKMNIHRKVPEPDYQEILSCDGAVYHECTIEELPKLSISVPSFEVTDVDMR